MFTEFRNSIKEICKQQGLTYAQIAQRSGLTESNIKSFMCKAANNESRRVAEKLADALGLVLIYKDGEYQAKAKEV